MLTVTEEQRQAAAARLANSPLGSLDPGASLLVQGGFCPLCGQSADEFVDDLSLREYGISGLCQSCQDQTFGLDGDGPMEVATDPSLFEAEEDA